MILSAIGILGGYGVAWVGAGFPLGSLWWLSLLAPAAGGIGIAARHRGWLTAGLYLQVGLAAAVAVRGELMAALGATALSVWGFDMATLWLARLDLGERARTRRLAREAVLRSTVLNLAGVGVALGFASFRLPLPFWGLVGGTVGLWLAVVFLLRLLRKAYGWGGDASGNRSRSSGPTS